ncbi:MAG: penicillin-binding protein 2 [Burkholderiaceae bacterium]
MINAISQSDFRRRATVAVLFVAFLFGLILLRLGTLQIWQFDNFATKAENNRVALLPIQAPRGLILDRHGLVLARNDAGFSAEIEPFKVEDKEGLIASLRDLLKLSDGDIRRFKRAVADARKFDSVPIKTRLTDEEVAKLAARLTQLPGVKLERRAIRSYPFGLHGAHLLGHIGRISKRDQERLERDDLSDAYFGVTHIGKLGLEKSYESALKGEIGFQRMEVTASGRIVRELDIRPAEPGQNISLSIDFELQQLVENLYGQRKGAAVVLSPKTGEILALVSMPTFDPNLFIDGIDPELWNGLNNSPNKPLLNRAIRGIYPPGSTYKPFMAFAALASGERRPSDTISDPGYFLLDNHRFRDSKPEGHGTVDMKKSIVVSSDTYYYKLAFDMGVDKIFKHISPFGFGALTGIDIDGEVAGILPSTSWKKKRFGKDWFPGETPSIGIGQGYNAFTMLQLARGTAAIANGGRLVTPHLVRQIEEPSNKNKLLLDPPAERTLALEEDWIKLVHEAMREVNISGTGANVFRGAKYAAAGKTGTAQVFTIGQNEKYQANKIPERLRDHSLFIAFAPIEDPKVAMAIVVENGGFGAAAAAPIARKVLDFLLVEQAAKGRTLP